MFHPSHRRTGDFINAVKELIPVQRLQPHQVAAAAHPETCTKQLAAKPKPSRQALERKVNEQLSEPEPKLD